MPGIDHPRNGRSVGNAVAAALLLTILTQIIYMLLLGRPRAA